MTTVGVPEPAAAPPVAIVLMGPAGSGKSTIGRLLADAIGADWLDADDEHTPESIARMRRGIALTDAEREPWLRRLHARLSRSLRAGRTVVLACSALRQAHRDLLRGGDDRVGFVYLAVDAGELRRRLATRGGHFAGPALLDSQLAALEVPPDALRVDGQAPPAAQVAAIRQAFNLGARNG